MHWKSHHSKENVGREASLGMKRVLVLVREAMEELSGWLQHRGANYLDNWGGSNVMSAKLMNSGMKVNVGPIGNFNQSWQAWTWGRQQWSHLLKSQSLVRLHKVIVLGLHDIWCDLGTFLVAGLVRVADVMIGRGSSNKKNGRKEQDQETTLNIWMKLILIMNWECKACYY